MPYSTRRYGSNHRWLMKALREVAGELERLVSGLSERSLTWRPSPERWCAKEILGYLAESEREDLDAVRAVLARDGARIAERRAHLIPGERDLTAEARDELLWDFVGRREELLWLLDLAGGDWEHAGEHPYRGRVTVSELVHEINERDLEAMWQLRQLQEEFASAPARRLAF